jgi:pyruvate,water dikinase
MTPMAPQTWLPDPSHYPEQMSPLSATVWFEAVGTGLHRAMRELRAPFGGFEARTHLGWAYEGELEPDWTPDKDGLSAAASGLGVRWDGELRPRSAAITQDLHGLRPETPPTAEAVAALDRAWDLILEQWTIHFLAVVPAQVAIETFTDAYGAAIGGDDALAPYRLLDLRSNESAQADRELWSLAGLAREVGVDDVLREHRPGEALQRLRQLGDGRRLLRALDVYLERFGGRARWHELSVPREVERPDMTLDGIRLFLESGAPPPPDRTAEAEQAEADVLARAPNLAPALAAAIVGYGLKESHVYHIDYPGLLATREVLLGFGRRLTAEGRLASPDDVWMLRRDEVRAATAGELRSTRDLVIERRAELAEGLVEDPRSFLGEPPVTVERPAALEKFYGQAASATKAGGRTLRGTGASDAAGQGVARVVKDGADFRRIRPGDVLVATTTTPAWTPLFPSLAGLVTETGGVLSHAAIVAREYGLPTVVGVGNATTSIPDGARVRVDGRTGEVTLLGVERD